MNTLSTITCVVFGLSSLLVAQEAQDAKKADAPTVKLQSVGPISFADGHTLLVSDPKAAVIYSVDIQDLAGEGLTKATAIAKIDSKIAALLGTEARGINIVDVAVHPTTRQVYLSVMRGDQPVLLQVSAKDKFREISLAARKIGKAELKNAPNAAPANASGRGTGRSARRANRRRGQRGRGSQRMESITDVACVGDKVIVAGLSNEEFSSKLRVLEYPFEKTNKGASVEIFHGAHGRYETRSPVRTFVSFEVAGKPHIVAAYTCTPLVLFPLADLEPGKKVKGKTIAELGNRNRPLDMIAYEKDGKDFLLMANSSRGVMRIPADKLGENEGIESRVGGGGSAGQAYETIKGMEGVLQLDKLDATHALILVRAADGELTLKAVPLP